MPSATRKTKTNSGKALSSAWKWNRYRKTSELSPSAAAKESTTVPISSSGATTARSSRASTSSTTTSTIGMIVKSSCREARWVSTTTAVFPPTSARAPGTACSAARTRSTVSWAALLDGSLLISPVR